MKLVAPSLAAAGAIILTAPAAATTITGGFRALVYSDYQDRLGIGCASSSRPPPAEAGSLVLVRRTLSSSVGGFRTRERRNAT